MLGLGTAIEAYAEATATFASADYYNSGDEMYAARAAVGEAVEAIRTMVGKLEARAAG